jgi:hypothetical protein
VAPDATTLARLAGYYVSDWGPGLTLRATDGKLIASGAVAPPLEAKFLPNGDFYFNGPAYRFSPRSGGGLAEIQGAGGLEVLHRRADRVEPSAADLAALAGRYHSDEIDSSYDLAVAEGALILSCLRFPPLKLAPADEDAFDAPWMRLTVLRDGAGAPSGFAVATGRVRGLRFRKID